MSICDGPAIGNLIYTAIIFLVALLCLGFGWAMGTINKEMKK